MPNESLSIHLSPPALQRALGERARELRLAQNLSQQELAGRAGLGLATVQRFERTGQASLRSVVKLAFVLGAEQGFDALFPLPEVRSITEALRQEATLGQRRRRARPTR